MLDVNQSLAEAERRLREAENVRADRLEKERQEAQAITDAENQIKNLRRQKAGQDWNAALEANHVCLAENAEAVAAYRDGLYRVLSEFRAALAKLDNQVEPTFRAQWQHVQRAMGAASQQMLADKMDIPDTDGKAAAIEVSVELSERARAFTSALPTESVMVRFVRDATDPDDRNARLGICQAILGHILQVSPTLTNEQIQAKMDGDLWRQFEGRGMGY